MSVRGGVLTGRQTDVSVNNLLIESLQDKEKISGIGVNFSFGVVHGTTYDKNTGSAVRDDRYSGSVGGTQTEGDRAWVKEQSGIYGTEKADVTVNDKLTLIGGIIANIDRNGNDKGNLTLKYGSIEARDIGNHDDLRSISANVSISERSESEKTKKVINKNVAERNLSKNDITYVPNRVNEEYTVGVQGHKAEGITRATIGQGTVNSVKGIQQVGVNRDTAKSNEITGNVKVSPVSYTYMSEQNNWEDFNKITTSNMGSIGKFIDDLGVFMDTLDGVREHGRGNLEGILATNTFKIIDRIERPVSEYVTRFTSLVPTAEGHGGIMDQIVRLIRQDETPIIEISLSKDRDGKSQVNMKELDEISDNNIGNGVVRIGTNGIIELKEQGTRNVIFKNLTDEDIERYNNGETVSFIMVYNKTRGAVADLLESALGKMFDGSASSMGLSIGVNRGAAIAYASRDKTQTNEMTFYSQGNIIGLGAYNILKSNGISLGTRENPVGIRLYGSPVTTKVFRNLSEDLGIRVVGSAINIPDMIGNDGKWFGIIGERRPIIGTMNLENLNKKWKDSEMISNLPILKALFREEAGTVLPLPIKVSDEEMTEYNSLSEEGKISWLRKHNYSMPITNRELDKISSNYEIELEGRMLSHNSIMSKMLNDGHGSYTYYSAVIAGEIDSLLNNYQNQPIKTDTMTRELEKEIAGRYVAIQELLVNQFKYGPAIDNKSKGLIGGLNEYNANQSYIDFRNGNYRYGVEFPENNYILNTMNRGIQDNQLSAQDISAYINILRSGVGTR